MASHTRAAKVTAVRCTPRATDTRDACDLLEAPAKRSQPAASENLTSLKHRVIEMVVDLGQEEARERLTFTDCPETFESYVKDPPRWPAAAAAATPREPRPRSTDCTSVRNSLSERISSTHNIVCASNSRSIGRAFLRRLGRRHRDRGLYLEKAGVAGGVVRWRVKTT